MWHYPVAGGQCVGFLANVCQGLGLSVLARELVGYQNHLGSCALYLAAVHHQVGIRIAVSLLGNQHTV